MEASMLSREHRSVRVGALHDAAVGLLVLALAHGGTSGCGGQSEAGDNGAASDLSCAGAPKTGELKLQGTLGGQAINIDQSPASGVFEQWMTGDFRVPMPITINDAAVDVTPTDVQIDLTWTGIVSNGSSASAAGTLVLPEGQPFAQMRLCVGNGSTINPNQAGTNFVLTGFTQGPACTQPVSGELRGCWGSFP
jgi:hypothetical protein